ncbi:SnoaL-like domain-containing protein [Massilia sp. PDC64]|nr:nuclear transport factor 2 family protein [Massilia sp. PDC64]SDE77329.1 SnoaL-like domain-containing protein [Massilia sp. PDC64]
MKTFAIRYAAAIAVAALVLPARAQQDLRAQLQRRADALGADWTRHDARALAAGYFTRDVTTLGEGGTDLVRGTAQLETTLQALFRETKTARLAVHEAWPLGPDAAYAWVVWDCNVDQAPASRFKVRSLYVFRREGGVWKIAADAYSMGGIPR